MFDFKVSTLVVILALGTTAVSPAIAGQASDASSKNISSIDVKVQQSDLDKKTDAKMQAILQERVNNSVEIDSTTNQSTGCQALPAEIEKDIKERVKAIQGFEECEYRTILEGSFASGRFDDIFVQYDVEDPCFDKKVEPGTACGNFDLQYWAAYVKVDKAYHAVAASMAPKNRTKPDRIVDGKVMVHVFTYGHHDPNCCPSIDTLKEYRVVHGKFIEYKTMPQKPDS